MKFEKESLVLYSLHLMEEEPEEARFLKKEHLASALGITANTLDLYLSRLTSRDLILRKKLKYTSDLTKNVEITDKGKGEVKEVLGAIDGLLLSEERHNIPSCIPVRTILERMPDPMEKVFFLALYTQTKYFDLPMVLNTLKISKEQTNLVNMLCYLEPNPCGTRKESFVESFFNTSLYGKIDKNMLASDNWNKDELEALIILAQAKMRMGKYDEVKMIHEHLLKNRTDLTQNQWFIIKIDQVLLLRRERKYDEGIKLIDQLLSTIDNKVYVAFVKMIKGQLMHRIGRDKEGRELFRSAISSFNAFGLPIFLSIAHNLRGVCNFINEDYSEAEKDWIKARKYAKEAKSEYAEAKILPNIADVYMKKGNHETAATLLKKAKQIFQSFHDYDGIANIEFNLALLSLEMGELEKAKEHFNLCNTVAFPLPAPEDRVIYRDAFIKRASEKGFRNIANII